MRRDIYAEAVTEAQGRPIWWSPWKLRAALRSERISSSLYALKFKEYIDATHGQRGPTPDLVAVLREFVDPDDHITCIEHGGGEDEARFFVVIDRPAWLTKREVALLGEALEHRGLTRSGK